MIMDRKQMAAVSMIGIAIVLLVLLTVIKVNTDEQAAQLCDFLHSADGGMKDIGSCPVHNSKTSWYITGAYGLSFVLLAYGLFTFFSRSAFSSTESALPKKRHAPLNLEGFEEEERQICKLLQQHEGSLYQSDLVKLLEMSKVRLTRVLDKLETKGILERRRRGMTNIVVLK